MKQYADNNGFTRLKNSMKSKVTNEFGQVHGISGLFVAENSILPFIGAANPTLTTVAVAMRTADYIVEKEDE